MGEKTRRRASNPNHANNPNSNDTNTPLLQKLLTTLNMVKSKVQRKLINVKTNARTRTKINRLRSVTQASIMAFAGTIAFVIFLITKYHLSFQTILHSRTLKGIIPEELLTHPINQNGGDGGGGDGDSGEGQGNSIFVPNPKLSASENKAAEFKKKFDDRLSNWKPAIPVAPPKGHLAQQIGAQQAQVAANQAINPNYTAPGAPNQYSSSSSISSNKIVFRSSSKLDPPNLEEINYEREPESLEFIFHNKLPKSGSSTMNGLLKALARQNSFTFEKLEPIDIPGDKFDLENPLVKYLKIHLKPPYFLLKHHYFYNFSKYDLPEGIREATYVNVIRDPVDWFASHYYFSRFGWNRKASDRGFAGSDVDRDRVSKV